MQVRIATSAFCLLLPFACVAADDGELWEVASQMNIPGISGSSSYVTDRPLRQRVLSHQTTPYTNSWNTI